METKGFFQFEIIINILFSSFCFISICYGSAVIINILILSMRGSSLYVRIWRLWTSCSDAYIRQILTYEDGPRTERFKRHKHSDPTEKSEPSKFEYAFPRLCVSLPQILMFKQKSENEDFPNFLYYPLVKFYNQNAKKSVVVANIELFHLWHRESVCCYQLQKMSSARSGKYFKKGPGGRGEKEVVTEREHELRIQVCQSGLRG